MIINRETTERVIHVDLEPGEQWDDRGYDARQPCWRVTRLEIQIFTTTAHDETIIRVTTWARNVLKNGTLGLKTYDRSYAEDFWSEKEPLATLVNKVLGRPWTTVSEEEDLTV